MTTDEFRETYEEKAAFTKVRKAENDYSRRLRKLASHIMDLVREFATVDIGGYPVDLGHLENLLLRYGHVIEPWARAVAGRFILDVSRRDEVAWRIYSRKISRSLEKEIKTAPTGDMLRRFLETQVSLITSLPTEAAKRVNDIAINNLYSSTRASELSKQIMETGHVTKSRANLIARTETARVASSLMMVRSIHIGAKQYIWRTVRDADVRPSHRVMEGQVVDWNNPPEVDPNKFYHAGMYINCRCVPGDTLVQSVGDICRAYRTVYKGPLVVLRAGDAVVETTPNHPILTPKGWVAASKLQIGDQVLQVPFESSGSVVHDVDDKLIRFDELFESLSRVGKIESTSEFDFYGDVFHDQVKIVTLPGNLPLRPETGFVQDLCDHMIPNADRGVVDCGVLRGNLEPKQALISGRSDALDMLLRSFVEGDQFVGNLLVSQGDAIFQQQVLDILSGALESFGQFGSPIAGLIGLDDFGDRHVGAHTGMQQAGMFPSVGSSCDDSTARSKFLTQDIGVNFDRTGRINEHRASFDQMLRVIDISYRDFFGHVFTLETSSGYYGVSGSMIASKNCFCEPIIPDKYLP